MGLRGPWSGRGLISPFHSNSGPSPPCSPCRTRSLDLPEETCPAPSRPRVSMLGTGEQVLAGDACGPPSPSFCPSAALLLGTVSAAAQGAGALQRSLGCFSQRGGAGAWALGTEGQEGPAVVQWAGAPGPALPWDRAEVPWPVQGDDPSLGGRVGVCNLGHAWGAGRPRLWLLFLPSFSAQHPLGTWLGPLLSPGTTLWSFFFPGLLGVRGCGAGAEGGSWAFDRVEEYTPRS
ncbi:hypothetical protein HJG60_010576 [Phyllostomus discolor]|uniref:Uncharacterized protein n=1 Tax=Phyllostomus discolor TaxID=89673 RepID=A0A834EEX0_9CHIR|nr:hypothetical protein HJG60_010576 [Phyllostomus discolor]